MNLAQYKTSLNLNKLTSEFFDFVSKYLDLNQDVPEEQIKAYLRPWFGLDKVDEINTWMYTQFQAEVQRQKYRLALEFCASKIGYEVINYMDDRIVSANMFWFTGEHPEPISWIFVVNNKVIGKGMEAPGSINKNSIENWLLNAINYFLKTKEVVRVSN